MWALIIIWVLGATVVLWEFFQRSAPPAASPATTPATVPVSPSSSQPER